MFYINSIFLCENRDQESRSCKSYAQLFLWLSVSIFLSIPVDLPAAEPFNVVLISSGSSDTYTKTAASIESIIKKSSTSPIRSRTVSINDAYTEKETLHKSTDLFVPIGQRALKETLKLSGDIPILATLISETSFKNVTSASDSSKIHQRIGAIYIDQPIERHLLFSKLALANNRRYGFIISSDNKDTINQLDSLLINDKHHIEILSPGNNVISALSRTLDKSDVVIALPDPIVFNLRTTRNILLSTYRKRIPMIGFSKSYVKAGALAAIYSTPELIGKQTGEHIAHLVKQSLLHKGVIFLSRYHAKYFSISVNNRVSRSLGLPALDANSLEKRVLEKEKASHE